MVVIVWSNHRTRSMFNEQPMILENDWKQYFIKNNTHSGPLRCRCCCCCRWRRMWEWCLYAATELCMDDFVCSDVFKMYTLLWKVFVQSGKWIKMGWILFFLNRTAWLSVPLNSKSTDVLKNSGLKQTVATVHAITDTSADAGNIHLATKRSHAFLYTADANRLSLFSMHVERYARLVYQMNVRWRFCVGILAFSFGWLACVRACVCMRLVSFIGCYPPCECGTLTMLWLR